MKMAPKAAEASHMTGNYGSLAVECGSLRADTRKLAI